jgi:hypothetical protein
MLNFWRNLTVSIFKAKKGEYYEVNSLCRVRERIGRGDTVRHHRGPWRLVMSNLRWDMPLA